MEMRRGSGKRLAVALLLASGLSAAAGAQEEGGARRSVVPAPVPRIAEPEPEPPAEQETPERLSLNLRGGTILTFESSLDDSPGDVSIWRAGGGLGAGYWLTERVRLGASFDTEVSWYDFDDATGLIPGTDDPIDLGQETAFGVRTVIIHDREWSWFVGGRISSGAEEGADLSDSITGGGVAGARWQMDERFALTLGVAGSSRLEEDPLVIPLIGFEWEVNDDVRVTSTGPGTFEALDSLGLRVFADVAEDVEVMLGVRWKLREYRLDEDSTVASEGIFRDARVTLDVGLLWEPADGVSLGVLGGVVAWQEYAVDDSDGDEISEVNSDPAGFVALGGRIEF